MTQNKSSCCQEGIDYRSGEEGTGYMSCQKCLQPCDVFVENKVKVLWGDDKRSFEKEILEIIKRYGSEVDSHGWEIDSRFEAAKKILKLLNKIRP